MILEAVTKLREYFTSKTFNVFWTQVHWRPLSIPPHYSASSILDDRTAMFSSSVSKAARHGIAKSCEICRFGVIVVIVIQVYIICSDGVADEVSGLRQAAAVPRCGDVVTRDHLSVQRDLIGKLVPITVCIRITIIRSNGYTFSRISCC